jgi:predicted transcriptional regulator
MVHIIHSQIAEVYGIEESIILQNIFYWVSKNKANQKNFHDGHYWTYNSSQGLTELFPFMAPYPKGEDGLPDTSKPRTNQRIKRVIKNLIEAGLIKSGNYNKTGYDRTAWYTLTEQGENLFNSINCTIHGSKMNNGKFENDPPIPKEYTEEYKEEKIKLHSHKFSEENIQGESENDLSSSETLQEETRKEPAKKSNNYKLTDEEVKLLEPFHKGLIEEIDKLAKVKYTKSIKPICRVYDHLNKNINTLRNVYVYFRTYRDHEHKYAVVVHSLESFADKIDKLIYEAKRRTRQLEAKNQSAIYHIDHNRKIVVFNSFKNIPQKDIETLKILVDEKKYNPIIMKPLVGEYNPTFFKAEPPKRNPLA